jgi:membrane-bound inhibitor of C-type lysozyme
MRETALPKRIDYRCANGRFMQVQRLPENNAAAVLVDGNPIVLSRANSAAQEKYGDGRYVLYLQGEHAMLEDNGRVVFGQCNAGPLPKRVVEGFGK